MKFLVLGLPRSRTGWLSVFLSTSDVLCFHEGLDGCFTMQQYKQKVSGKADSNTALIFFDIRKHFPDTKVIVINSSLEKAISFGKEEYGEDVTDALTSAQEKIRKLDALHIDFDDINERLQEIWEYVHDTPYDELRANELIKLDIQMRDIHSMDVDALTQLITDEITSQA